MKEYGRIANKTDNRVKEKYLCTLFIVGYVIITKTRFIILFSILCGVLMRLCMCAGVRACVLLRRKGTSSVDE